MKVTKTFVKAVLAVLESNNHAWSAEIKQYSDTIWILTFENTNSIKIEMYFTSSECVIGAFDSRDNYKWYCSMQLEKQSRDNFFYYIHGVLRTIDDDMCKINDRIWEEENASSETV